MAMCGVRVWYAECASLDVDGFLWTNLLPGTKNKATIEVFAGHLGEESVRETTTYAPSKCLVSRSRHGKPRFPFYLMASAVVG